MAGEKIKILWMLIGNYMKTFEFSRVTLQTIPKKGHWILTIYDKSLFDMSVL